MITERELQVLRHAQRILARQLKATDAMNSTAMVREYLQMRIAYLEHETFGCMFLNTRHHILAVEDLARGTIDKAQVYIREIVKRALYHNAAAMVLYHNHPSGVCEPSPADVALTNAIRSHMQVLEIRVLDHIVVSAGGTTSMAETGMI